MPKLRPIALLLLTLFGASSIALGFRGRSHERYAEQKTKHEIDCASWRALGGSAEACDATIVTRPKLLSKFEQTRDQIHVARVAIALGFESNIGAPTLSAALDAAVQLDKYGSVLSEVFAAALFDEVLDAIEGKPEKPRPSRTTNGKPTAASLSGSDSPLPSLQAFGPINTTPVQPSVARAILSGHELRSARHPLEGQRLYALSSMTAMRDDVMRAPFLLQPSYVSSVSADLMRDYTIAIADMERNILSSNEEGCRRVLGKRTTAYPRDLRLWFGLPGEVVCPKLVGVVRTAARLEKARRNHS